MVSDLEIKTNKEKQNPALSIILLHPNFVPNSLRIKMNQIHLYLQYSWRPVHENHPYNISDETTIYMFFVEINDFILPI